jgi:hypothetical protein
MPRLIWDSDDPEYDEDALLEATDNLRKSQKEEPWLHEPDDRADVDLDDDDPDVA